MSIIEFPVRPIQLICSLTIRKRLKSELSLLLYYQRKQPRVVLIIPPDRGLF